MVAQCVVPGGVKLVLLSDGHVLAVCEKDPTGDKRVFLRGSDAYKDKFLFGYGAGSWRWADDLAATGGLGAGVCSSGFDLT